MDCQISNSFSLRPACVHHNMTLFLKFQSFEFFTMQIIRCKINCSHDFLPFHIIYYTHYSTGAFDCQLYQWYKIVVMAIRTKPSPPPQFHDMMDI